MNKTHQLQIRISAEDKALIRARAANAGMDVSKWVLQQVLLPIEREFQALCRALAARPDARSFTFAELQDWLNRLTGNEFVRAVRHAPEAQLPAFEANYLAATVEQRPRSGESIRRGGRPPWKRSMRPGSLRPRRACGCIF